MWWGSTLKTPLYPKMIKDVILQESINEKLKEKYRVLDGRPIYRIVWSSEELEVRKGVTREFYGHIFLREYVTVGPRPKYWYLQHPCWVFEKLIFIQGYQALKDICEELPDCARGSYEPLYTFTDKDQKPLPLSEEIVELIIYSTQNPVKRSASDMEAMRIKEEAAEVKYFEDSLAEGERSPLFVWDNSEFVSLNQIKFREKYKKEFVEKD